MAETQATCPHCQAVLDAGSEYCAACGRSVAGALASPVEPAKAPAPGAGRAGQPTKDGQAEPAAPRARVADPAATQPLAVLQAPAAAAAPVVPELVKQPNFAKTMMGFDSSQIVKPRPAVLGPAGSAAQPAAAAAPVPQAPPVTSPAAASRGPATAPVNPSDSSEAAAVALSDRPRRALARTMLGISAEAAQHSARPPAASTQTAAGAEPPTQPARPASATSFGTPEAAPVPGAAQRGNPMARTMLGMAPLGASEPPRSGPPLPSASAGVGVGRTMLGLPPGAAEAAAAASEASYAQPAGEVRPRAHASQYPLPRTESGRPARKDPRTIWLMVAATLIVVVAALALLLRTPEAPRTDVSAKIVTTEAGEALLFEVPSVPEGSKIRFGGQEKPLSTGRASFALAADSLRVGDNLVLADVVRPDGETSPVRITLAVFYRIWVDTAALRSERSALDVIVTALPGTHVTLDGEELKLDGEGRAVRNYPIDVVSEAKSGMIEHVVRYRVQPPSGETVVDELRTRIPVAMMQVDRPGREVVTDRSAIEIAGAAAKDAQISIDKTSVPVKDGRFLFRLPLPAPGEYKPRVLASAAGKAPLEITLHITRVQDLADAARSFGPDKDISYAKLSPDPAIYRGQKVELEGRVYAVDPRGSDSVIQMFVRPCPSSRRCPLWVSDPHATDVGVDAWVRVLGTVQGEQQFRSEKNEVVTVPKVEAQFVLPAKP